MKPLYRYGIIALCFVVFFVLAPVLVVYTTGRVYDFTTHRFVGTGILSVATDPSGAQIYLNGKLAGTTPSHVRFLTPGEYDVKISKPGYDDWEKRLTIQDGIATFVNPNINALYLYKQQPAAAPVAANVQDLAPAGSGSFAYVTPTALALVAVGNPATSNVYPAPVGVSFAGAHVTPSQNGRFFVVRTGTAAVLFDASAKKFTGLPTAVPGTVQVTDNGNLYWLNGTSLAQVTWQDSQAVAKPVAQDVQAFDATNQGVYTIQKNASQPAASLVLIQLPSMQQVVLRAGLPSWENVSLYVNSQNQVFVNGDGELYSVGTGLNPVGASVAPVVFYEQYSKLLTATNNEVDLYDTGTGLSQLIARTSTLISGAQATPSTATVFFIGSGKLQAIETDTRDRQNSYVLANVGTDAEFYVTSDARYVLLLDAGTLTQLQVR